MLGAYRFQQIRNSCVGHWRPSRGPSGNLLIDGTGRTPPATLVNGPTWTPSGGNGGSGYALQFDGVNDHVNCGSGISPTFGPGNVTFSQWIRITTAIELKLIVTKGNASAGPAIFTRAANNRVEFRCPGAGSITSSDGSIAAEQWYHIVATRTGNVGQIYIDGLPNGSGLVGTSAWVSSSPFVVGTDTINGQFFRGLIDDVSIFDRALTASEVLELYKGGRGALDQRVNVPVVRGYDPGVASGFELSTTITELADTLVATVSVPIESSSTITEQADSLTATASVAVQSQSTITESADSVTATASVAVNSSSTITELADTLTATASVAISATTTITEQSDSLVATVQYGSGYSAETSIVEAADSITATASVAVRSSSTITEAADSLTATVSVAIVSSSTITELTDLVSITAIVGVDTGTSTATNVQIVAYRQSIVAIRNTIRAW